jgi:hypothetical protein
VKVATGPGLFDELSVPRVQAARRGPQCIKGSEQIVSPGALILTGYYFASSPGTTSRSRYSVGMSPGRVVAHQDPRSQETIREMLFAVSRKPRIKSTVQQYGPSARLPLRG